MLIKKKQRKFFNHNGYIKISNFFTKKEVKQLIRYVEEIENLKPIKGKTMIYSDKIKNRQYLTRTENFYEFHKGMNKFLRKKKIQALLTELIGDKPVLFKDKINWKYPGANGFEPHQDAQVWEGLYKNVKSFLSMTVSIDKSNSRNGCLELVKNKHQEGLFGNNKSAIPKENVKKFKWIKVTTKPGDMIFFGAYTPHRSSKNKSKLPRRMMYLTYNAKGDGDLRKEYYSNKRKSFPPNIERAKGKKYKYLI
tara:strand:- start:13 stop:765 length:753 start_codon:yes stop_codon:yes gene_type:complete